MTINLAGDILFDSIVDGEGLRVVIFTQGCPHHCIGCQNPQTWSISPNKEVDIEAVVKEIIENALVPNVTFSGGDPFVQPIECYNLAKSLRDKGTRSIWAYTGYVWEDLIASNEIGVKAFLSQLDVLVDGRFEKDKKSFELKFKGSSNQRLIDVQKSLKKKAVILFEN